MSSNVRDPWEQAQLYLKEVVDSDSYQHWFTQTRFQSYQDGRLTIQVPTPFFAKWLRDHYLDEISESVKQVQEDFLEVDFSPSDELARTLSQGLPRAEPKQARAPEPRPAPRHGTLNTRYTFDRFVIGSSNRFAHAAARAVADTPARAYNPLFLYGGTGLGKTHLMQAIGHEVLKRDRNANVVFISSEAFTNEFIEAIAKKSTIQFRMKYRKVDALLIDDIQFLSGKEGTQEEFFHTFNELYDMHKQIVLSSDSSPKEMEGMEKRLVSRFEWGLVTDIQPPDMETRVAILQNKAEEDSVPVPADVFEYIASYVTSNIRELEGALVTLLAHGKLTHTSISVSLAEEVLRGLIGTAKIKPITVEAIQRAVAEHYDVRISDLRGRSRERQVAYPRQIAMYLTRQLIPSLSLKEIGQAFGDKHHTTVLYACQMISEEIERDDAVRPLLQQLEKAIRS